MPNYKIYFTSKETTTGRLLPGDNCSVHSNKKPTESQAIEYVGKVIEHFNDTLRFGEEPREFVELTKIERV